MGSIWGRLVTQYFIIRSDCPLPNRWCRRKRGHCGTRYRKALLSGPPDLNVCRPVCLSVCLHACQAVWRLPPLSVRMPVYRFPPLSFITSNVDSRGPLVCITVCSSVSTYTIPVHHFLRLSVQANAYAPLFTLWCTCTYSLCLPLPIVSPLPLHSPPFPSMSDSVPLPLPSHPCQIQSPPFSSLSVAVPSFPTPVSPSPLPLPSHPCQSQSPHPLFTSL